MMLQAGGRLALVELPALLGVDLTHCERQVGRCCTKCWHFQRSRLAVQPDVQLQTAAAQLSAAVCTPPRHAPRLVFLWLFARMGVLDVIVLCRDQSPCTEC